LRRMTIVDMEPRKNRKSSKRKHVLYEDVHLLPTKRQEEGRFDEFNGASFSRAVFKLSTTPIADGIMAKVQQFYGTHLCIY